MGCLCCKDREKPDDEEAPQLPLIIHATHHDEVLLDSEQIPADVTSPKSRKHGSTHSSVQTPSRRPLLHRQKALMSRTKAEQKANRQHAELQEEKKDTRSLSEGSVSDYQFDEASLGNWVQAQHRITREKCWIQIYEMKGDESDGETEKRLELIRSLNYFNVLKMLDLFQSEGRFYAVYETTEGGDAEELVARLGGLSEKWAAALMRQVMQTLSYCHSKGLTLKTLSAKHILFTKSPTEDCTYVKLLIPVGEEDEGSSCMAPELKAKTYIGPANDLWSSGMLLCTLLAGECVLVKMQASFISKEFRLAYKKWQKMSKEAKAFALSLIAADVNKRPPLEKCLHHAWMCS